MDNIYLKWKNLVLIYAIPLLLLRHFLVMFSSLQQWVYSNAFWCVFLPIAVVGVTSQYLKRYLASRNDDVMILLLLTLVIGCSQYFYTQLIQLKVKEVNSLSEVVDYPQFSYFELAGEPIKLTMDDFSYATEIKKHQLIIALRTAREGLHFEGMAAKNIFQTDSNVWVIHEYNHYIRGQYKAPSNEQLEAYLNQVELELHTVSKNKIYQKISGYLKNHYLKEVHTKINTNFLSQNNLILQHGQPRTSDMIWSVFLMIASYFIGLTYIRFRTKRN